MSDNAREVIEVKNLDISFKMATGDVHAIRGVDFHLREKETENRPLSPGLILNRKSMILFICFK